MPCPPASREPTTLPMTAGTETTSPAARRPPVPVRADAGPAPDTCPACGGGGLVNAGPVYHPPGSHVGGVPIDLGGLTFSLLRCPRCAFRFKVPRIAGEDLLACYALADPNYWGVTVDPLKRNFDVIQAAVERHAPAGGGGRSILDVGCFTAAFLDYLGPAWGRYGVEPNESAAEVARSRGVTVLGRTLDDLDPAPRFDVVLAMDVVEHVVEPAPFFERASKLLKPGGAFVVTTGDTGAWNFRLQGPHYWYVSYLPEHVSFYRERTMNVLAGRHGMASVEHRRFSHQRDPLPARAHQLAKGVAFGLGVRLGWLGLPPLRRKMARRAGTVWMASRDHMVHVMRRA